MTNCPKCNAALVPGARFCIACGTELNSATNCPSCGAELPSDSAFCPRCGTRVGSAPQTPFQSQAQPMTEPVEASGEIKSYIGLNVLKIFLWFLATISILFTLYHILSFIVYNVYNGGTRCDDILRIYRERSLSSYRDELTVGLLVVLAFTVVFVTLAIVVGRVRKNKIRREQQGI